MERAVCFPCEGVTVHGTIHAPERSRAGRRDIGVVFLASGVRSRRGPNRLYVRFARRLCEEGYAVLRYDPPGVGDSFGAIESYTAYKKEYLDATDGVRQAVDYFQDATGVERLGMVGLCGGAFSAVMAAAREPRAEFLALTSLPIQDIGDMSISGALDAVVESYLCKVLDWRSWCRLFSGRSHYAWVLRSAFRVLGGNYHRPKPNEALWQAYRQCLRQKKKILLVYGTQDPLYGPFAGHYHKELKRLDGFDDCCRVHLVEDANHTFTQVRWQQELIETSLGWLDTALGGAADPCATGPLSLQKGLVLPEESAVCPSPLLSLENQ